jgi:hypothetical protein
VRLVAELVSICAGVTVIATYLGVNVRKWLRLRRLENEGREKQ